MDPADDFDPKRILVVDADDAMRLTHARVLEAHGLRPQPVADPAEALIEAIACTPSVIVLELLMPEISGLEFAVRLRHHYGRATPPLVLVSAHLGALSPAEQLMFDAVCARPYAIDSFVGSVRRLVRQHFERRRATSEVVLRPGPTPIAPLGSEEKG